MRSKWSRYSSSSASRSPCWARSTSARTRFASLSFFGRGLRHPSDARARARRRANPDVRRPRRSRRGSRGRTASRRRPRRGRPCSGRPRPRSEQSSPWPPASARSRSSAVCERDEHGQHLAALEGDLDAGRGRCSHRPTNSARTPPVASGWTNATCEAEQARGAARSSISSTPSAAQPRELRGDVVDLEGDVVHARARAWRGTCRPASRARAGRAARPDGRRRAATPPRRPARRPARDARASRRRARSSARSPRRGRRPRCRRGGRRAPLGDHFRRRARPARRACASRRRTRPMRASSRPREASSTNVTFRPRASSPRTAASSQTSVATPNRTISSGSSSSRSTSACGFVNTSKFFFRSRNSRPRASARRRS